MWAERDKVSVNLLIGSHCRWSWCGAAAKETAMTHEAAAVDDGTGEGDSVTVGKVQGDTEGEVGEGAFEDKSRGGIDVAAVVSEQQQQ